MSVYSFRIFFLFKYIVFSKWDNDIYCLQSDFPFTISINNSPQIYFEWLYGTLLYGHTIINWLITYYYYIFTLSSFIFYIHETDIIKIAFNLANLYNCLIKKIAGNKLMEKYICMLVLSIKLPNCFSKCTILYLTKKCKMILSYSQVMDFFLQVMNFSHCYFNFNLIITKVERIYCLYFPSTSRPQETLQ